MGVKMKHKLKHKLKQCIMLSLSVSFLAGSLSGCSHKEAGADTDAAVEECQAADTTEPVQVEETTDTEEMSLIQTFTSGDVAVIPEIKEYDFAAAKEAGTIRQIRGVLPGTDEGVWYTILIDGVEYYYGKYDFKDGEDADFFGYAIVSDEYSLQNGISVGMTMEEILEKYPDMVVMDFEGNHLRQKVTGHQGWNAFSYPRSYIGMDEDWEYGGKDYEWQEQFDCIMIADIDLGADTLPVCVGLLIKDSAVAAITFYNPTAG